MAPTAVGAPGTVEGITAFELAEAAPTPPEFAAFTLRI